MESKPLMSPNSKIREITEIDNQHALIEQRPENRRRGGDVKSSNLGAAA